MKITRENIDALNAVVKVDIAKADYSEKVEKILTDYRKTANIPGFRKGHVPMGMVKKQYGKAVLAEEVNKILQENLNKYLTEEKIDVLGNPLPRMKDISWEDDDYSFEFELGLSPEFDVDLSAKTKITRYDVKADDKMIDDQIENIQKQYGKIIAQNEISADSEITGTFSNETEGIENKFTFTLDQIKGKTNEKKIYWC
jgi:trigger factor